MSRKRAFMGDDAGARGSSFDEHDDDQGESVSAVPSTVPAAECGGAASVCAGARVRGVWCWVLLAAAASAVSVGAAACERRATPQREWLPSDHGQPTQDDPARTPAPATPEEGGVDRAATALFNVSCAGCHGRDGRGQGEQRPPGAQVPDFTSTAFLTQRSDAQLAEVIRNGRGLMPAFGKQVNEQGINVLVAHVRRFGAGPTNGP